MGNQNIASGRGSVALGSQAKNSVAIGRVINNYPGSVAIDASVGGTITPLRASMSNQFVVRAVGGIRLRTNESTTTGCNLPAGSGSFYCTSARGTKNHFRAVNESLILRQIAALPVLGWQYKTEPGNVRHLGPFAGDFRRAFGLQDMDSVLFVGLKELARQYEALQAHTSTLQADNEALRTRLARLEQQLQQLAVAPAIASHPRRRWARQPHPMAPDATPALAVTASE